ncbi:hypothetical protein ABE427_01965 [Acinetobacter higginsii]|uniref:hypothetical protein n=1 Tax=Acinetobacter higginsii TaxID=70347 RepID=UPI00320AFBF8
MENFSFKDALEIFKALTPYIVAFGVYLFWHVQKEKEVIAEEAKELILKINNLINLSGRLYEEIFFKYAEYTEIRNYDIDELSKRVKESIESARSSLTPYELKISEIFTALDFLNDSVQDKDLIIAIENYKFSVQKGLYNFSDKIIEIPNLGVQHDQPESSLLKIRESHESLIHVTSELKKTIIKYALFRSRLFNFSNKKN